MVFDAIGPAFWSSTASQDGAPDIGTRSCPLDADPSSYYYGDGPYDYVSWLADRFHDVLHAAEQPLWNGCTTSQMAAVAESDHIMPRDHIFALDYYNTKKLIKDLGLPMEKIDACKNGCMLYWKDDIDLDYCKFCGGARYKPTRVRNPNRKMTPYAVLRYLPITPRLQRLYVSKTTAEQMTWHATHQTEEGSMCHPYDVEAWRHFDRTHPNFAVEPCNVRLGLCTDGFALHEQYGHTYSCWPVILTPYNLPPGMYLSSEYTFLTMVIPGPSNPKRLIDIYLEPLIEELQNLWHVGCQMCDNAKDETFTMRAALMWIVNDLPAYGMASRWSTAGVMGCPVCMKDTRAFYLQNGRKACYFDCYRQFLPPIIPIDGTKKHLLKIESRERLHV
ncbi:UNVERIFIED_CONTAM: hypothetical protein Slati_2956800 [Sesamum latifolium]|uniref:Uncharacterized protein n=1 Tax=Sesamum latifolium TaxID=2727402 RepID=A0AAW2VFR7_9LAMI